MGTIHTLISEKGKQGTLDFGEFCRPEIEAAAAYMADEENAIGYLYSGWCQAALPHRRLPDEKGWQVRSGPVALIVQPGMRFGAANEPVPVGVPYGSRARLILIYLQAEAVRTQCREVELGRSLRVWMGKMGLAIGGSTVDAVRDQADRIARCSMTFEIEKGQKFGLLKQNLVDAAIFEENADRSSDRWLISLIKISYDSTPFQPDARPRSAAGGGEARAGGSGAARCAQPVIVAPRAKMNGPTRGSRLKPSEFPESWKISQLDDFG